MVTVPPPADVGPKVAAGPSPSGSQKNNKSPVLGKIIKILLLCLLFVPMAIYFLLRAVIFYVISIFRPAKAGSSSTLTPAHTESQQESLEQAEELPNMKKEASVQATVPGSMETNGPEGTQSVKPSQAPSPTTFPKTIEEFMEALKKLELHTPFAEVESPADMSIIVKFIEQKNKGKDLLPSIGLICHKGLSHFDDGRKAAASICIVAVQYLLDRVPMSTEEDIYTIIEKGVMIYKSLQGSHHFSAIIEFVNEERSLMGKSLLGPIIPEQCETIDEAFLKLMKETPFDIPFVGNVKEGFDNLLNMLDNVAKEHSQKACGVISCNEQMLVVYLPKPGQPYLFDPYGRANQGECQGASILRFHDISLLAAHLQKNLFKRGQAHFAMFMIGLKQ